jgi:large subunit ribosomal protein L10
MPNKNNVEMLEKVKKSIENSKGFFVVDYRGLTVKQAQDLRRTLRETNSEMKVYKNNIVRIALAEEGLPDIGESLVGTCAYVFFENDPVDAAKAIKKKGEELKKLAFVAGIADGKGLNADEAKAYADLASREELMAQLVYVMASPLRGIASVCAGPARGLVTALDAIAEQKKEAA